jgi:hypothetical protein
MSSSSRLAVRLDRENHRPDRGLVPPVWFDVVS